MIRFAVGPILRALSLALMTSGATSAGSGNYLYHNDREARTVISEYTETSGHFLDSTNPRVVEFYSPSCPACIGFKPEYIRLAQETKKLYPTVEFYTVSCEDHHSMCTKFSIGSYPSIMTFKEGGDQQGNILKKSASSKYSPSKIQAALQLQSTNAALDIRRRVQSDGSAADDDDDGGANDRVDDNDASATDDDQVNSKSNDGGFPNDMDSKQGDDDDNTQQDPVFPEGEPSNDDEGEPSNEDEDGNDDDNRSGATNRSGDNQGDDDDDDRVEKDSDADVDSERSEDESQRAFQKFGGMGVDRPMSIPRPEMARMDGMRMPPGQVVPPMIGGVGVKGHVAGAGSAKARQGMTRDMDRWSQQVLERKKVIEQRRKGLGGMIRKDKDQSMARPKRGRLPSAQKQVTAKATPDGATAAMKARTPGTPEYEERKAALLERIATARKRHNSRTGTTEEIKKGGATPILQKENLPFSKNVKKPGFIAKQAEKIPLVKRMVKMSEEEELILDASLSFIYGLRYGVYDSDKPLTFEKKMALQNWLDLLSVSLPPEWGLHKLIDKLRRRIKSVAESDKNLAAILDEYEMPRKSWSKSCSKRRAGGGFSCGFWKLLHTVTVGVAEHRGGRNLIDSGMVNPGTPTYSPIDAANTIRDYIGYFFGCEECRTNFVKHYDQCSNNRRCDRLASDDESASVADWKELALWLWEVHNEISVRIVKERAEKKTRIQASFASRTNTLSAVNRPAQRSMTDIQDEVTVLWPDISTCLLCFEDDGTWDEPEVFNMLERTYWPGADLDPKSDKLLSFDGESQGLGLLWIVMFLALYLVYKMVSSNSYAIHRSVLATRQMIASAGNMTTGGGGIGGGGKKLRSV